MKQIYLSVFSLLLWIGVSAQNIVVTTPQARNVVLEEFTGINCGYCPQGHALGEEISTNNPNRVVLVNVHGGSYAVPSSGQNDFRTVYGDALISDQGVTGFPAGSVNRHLFPGETSIATGRGSWTNNANLIFPQRSPVNIGFETSYNSTTRELTINVEAYYTLSSPEAINFLQIAFLQNHVIGYQSDYTNGSTNSYDHKHILRELITGQWGDSITTTQQGDLFTKQFVYTVPGNFNGDTVLIENCDIAVYITEGHHETYTGVVSPAENSTNDGSTSLYIGDLVVANDILEGIPSNVTHFDGDITSSLSGTEDFKFILTTDAPSDWNASFTVNSNTFTDTGIVSLVGDAPVDLDIDVTPSDSAYFAKYTLSMVSESYPTASIKIAEVYVVSGIVDLIVNGTGGFGDGNSYSWEQLYKNAFDSITNAAYGIVDADIMVKGFNANAMSTIKHIYLNIGWTFPSLKDDEATALMEFMDNGGNLFISGQDIGWDIKSGDGYGTAITQDFYTNYLHASYVNDGGTTNNSMDAVTSDNIFSNSPSTPIVDVYAGNFFPDQINPINGAFPIFNYNSATNIGGIRYYEGNYKIVYIAYGLEMLQNEDVKNEFVETVYNWFHGTSLDLYVSNKEDITCNGVCTGVATVTPEGGTPPYIYIWENTSQSDSTAIDLCAGSYSVNIIDANLDTVNINIDITEPNYINVVPNVNYTSCNSCNDGLIQLNVTDGSGIFEYLWNTTETTSSIDSLAVGTYTVTVTDSLCNHQVIDTFNLRVILSAIIDNANDASCIDVCDGELSITTNGGLNPYTYQWSNSSLTDSAYTDLCADIYTITVTDNENNTVILTDTIAEPEVLTIAQDSVVNATCATCSDGTAMVIVDGGTNDYSYLWNDPQSQTTSTATNLSQGQYTVTITDNLCGNTIVYTLDIGVTIGVNELDISNINFYPNPANNIINFTEDINKTCIIKDVSGRVIKELFVNRTINVSELETGIYFISIEGNTGVLKFKKN